MMKMGYHSDRHRRTKSEQEIKEEQGYYRCHNREKAWKWVKPRTCRHRCSLFPCIETTCVPTAFHLYMSEVMQGLTETQR